MYSVILRSSSYLKKQLIINVIICEYADAPTCRRCIKDV